MVWRSDHHSALAEVDDIAVLDDVFLAFEPLKVLGLGFLERAGLVEIVEGRDLGPDEALGDVGVDLAGRFDGVRAALEIPAADLGLSGREEGDDPNRIVGLRMIRSRPNSVIPRSAMNTARSSGSSWESSSSSFASIATAREPSRAANRGRPVPERR